MSLIFAIIGGLVAAGLFTLPLIVQARRRKIDGNRLAWHCGCLKGERAISSPLAKD